MSDFGKNKTKQEKTITREHHIKELTGDVIIAWQFSQEQLSVRLKLVIDLSPITNLWCLRRSSVCQWNGSSDKKKKQSERFRSQL